jgi:hypothetical protein
MKENMTKIELLRQNFEWATKFNENSDKMFDYLWDYSVKLGEDPIDMINLFINITINFEKITNEEKNNQ